MSNDPFPPLIQKCIDSWKKFCPDYQFIKWDSSNVDLDYCPFIREAYDAKKWAFVSDVVRLYAVVNYGGIYLDSDVEVIKPLNDLLKFPAVSGFETGNFIAANSIACEKGHPAFVEFLKAYEGIHFIKPDGTFDKTTIPERISNICVKYGFVRDNTEQTLSNGLHILPQDYLSPKNCVTREVNITSNTYMIHHFDGSWGTEKNHYRGQLREKLIKFHVPKRIRGNIVNFTTALKFDGAYEALLVILRFIGKRIGLIHK